MLWNWHTVGACFITPQWQIATEGAMVGTCFGVMYLVVALEALNRGRKQFDRYLIRKRREAAEARHHQVSPTAPENANQQTLPAPVPAPGAGCCDGSGRSSATAVVGPERNGPMGCGGDAAASVKEKPSLAAQAAQSAGAAAASITVAGGPRAVASGEQGRPARFRPKVWQQMIRALLYAAQFTVTYFIMM